MKFLNIAALLAVASKVAFAAPTPSPEGEGDDAQVLGQVVFSDAAIISNYTVPSDVVPIVAEVDGVTYVININGTIAEEEYSELSSEGGDVEKREAKWHWLLYGPNMPRLKREVGDVEKREAKWHWLLYGPNMPRLKREVGDVEKREAKWHWLLYGPNMPRL